jgi:hypothetical protein
MRETFFVGSHCPRCPKALVSPSAAALYSAVIDLRLESRETDRSWFSRTRSQLDYHWYHVSSPDDECVLLLPEVVRDARRAFFDPNATSLRLQQSTAQ